MFARKPNRGGEEFQRAATLIAFAEIAPAELQLVNEVTEQRNSQNERIVPAS
jgi:hypothetical protein